MPTLTQSLHPHDLGHLRIIAEHWGLELNAPDARIALPLLVDALLDADLITEIISALPREAQTALTTLLENDGRLPWLQFTRTFGQVRAMGPGRRDRERPDRTPVSVAEMLWYRALIARAFFETSAGAQEFAYLPDDLRPFISTLSSMKTQAEFPERSPLLGRAATFVERAQPIFVSDRILDHICTLLAAHRLNTDRKDQFGDAPPDLPLFTLSMLDTADLLDSTGMPNIEATRVHLEAERGIALAQLFKAWLNSESHNDLQHVPHLQLEGEWRNDPLGTRWFILALLKKIPMDTWWSLSAFLADLRRDFPDFQRPASDYDSWFIRDTRSGEFLHGFEHWDEIDGALIRYLVTGPFHWLGVLDLAVPDEEMPPNQASAFRLSKWANELLEMGSSPKLQPEEAPMHVRSDGRISVPFLAPRAARYQIARFCQWEEPSSHEYRYRFTPGSLELALDQGLQIKHLQTLLVRHAKHIPPNMEKALKRWDQRGTEVRLQAVMILRLSSPDLLQSVRASRAARFLGDPLGPTTVIIKSGAGEKVLEILAEMGYLGEIVDFG